MDNPSLEYFVEIAKWLNISKAADQLHISQQSLSAYIQKLEKHYGVMLLKRKPKLTLTPAGERLLLAAEEIERIYEELDADLANLGEVRDIRFSLGIFEPLISLVMQNLPIVEISRKYPNLSFHITTGYKKDLLERLSRRQVDLALLGLVSYDSIDEEIRKDVEVLPLGRDEDCILITDEVMHLYFVDEYEKYVQKFSQGVDLLDLAHVPIVMHPVESGVSKKVRKYFMDNHCTFKFFGEAPSQDSVVSLVLKNKAYGLGSRMALRMLLGVTEKKYLIFPLAKPRLSRELALLYPKKQRKDSCLPAVAGMIAESWRHFVQEAVPEMKLPEENEE